MSHSLSKRFVFGSNCATYLDPATLEYDFFVGGPNRERQLLELGRKQLSLMRAARDAHVAGSAHIANEIQLASDKISREIEWAALQHARDTSAVRDAIESLESSLHADLRESHWLLAQVENRLADVTAILQKPRSVEANELIHQAIENLINGYHPEAKDRLLKGLEFDNTDYLIHRNLGFVFVHEGSAAQALEHFGKAVAFAPTTKLRLSALCDLARTYYASSNYADAANTLQSGVVLLKNDTTLAEPVERARIVYDQAVYCALAGRLEDSLAHLDRAIDLDVGCFAKALTDADFGSVHESIEEFLAEKMRANMNAAEQLAGSLQDKLALLDRPNSRRSSGLVDRCKVLARRAQERLDRGNYTSSKIVRASLWRLNAVADALIEARGIQERLREARAMLQADDVAFLRMENEERGERARLGRAATKRAHERSMAAGLSRLACVMLSFVGSGALAIAIINGSWGGCSRYNAGNGSILGTMVWFVFNVLLLPAGLVLPFVVARQVGRKMGAHVRRAGTEAAIQYERPQAHTELMVKRAADSSTVGRLETRLAEASRRARRLVQDVADQLR